MNLLTMVKEINMNIVDYIDEDNLIKKEDKDMLTELIHYTLKKEDISFNYEVSVSFVDNLAIQKLNNDYRGIDEVTDVLSFPLIEDFNAEFSNHVYPLGDIVISIDKVTEQAKLYNHSFKRELGFLIVHSILHLLGYIHETDAEEKEMFQRQETILKEFGLERE